MVGADLLRIVFWVNGVTFVMPVADLLAIRGVNEDDLTLQDQSSSPFQLGFMTYRKIDAQVYNFAELFDLDEENSCKDGPLLIFAGSVNPWAVRVDHVDGVINAAHFEFQDLPTYLLRDEFVPYHQIALYDGELLVSVDSQQIDQAWRRSV